MRADIHPKYRKIQVTCSCGHVIETASTVEAYHVEVCSACHPFFTGKQKLVDTAGRIEKFQKKYAQKKDAKAAKSA